MFCDQIYNNSTEHGFFRLLSPCVTDELCQATKRQNRLLPHSLAASFLEVHT